MIEINSKIRSQLLNFVVQWNFLILIYKDFIINSWGVFIINSDTFIGNVVWEYIHQCGFKSGNLFMNIFIQEHKMLVYHFNCFSYWINVGSFKIPDTSLIRWRIDTFNVQLTINSLMVTVWMKGWMNSTISYQTGLVSKYKVNTRRRSCEQMSWLSY